MSDRLKPEVTKVSTLAGANTPKPAIAAATTPNEVLHAAAVDPQTEAVLAAAFATVVQQYGHSPIACVVVYLLAWATQHYGFPTLDPVMTQIISATIAAAAGYGYQWVARRVGAQAKAAV